MPSQWVWNRISFESYFAYSQLLLALKLFCINGWRSIFSCKNSSSYFAHVLLRFFIYHYHLIHYLLQLIHGTYFLMNMSLSFTYFLNYPISTNWILHPRYFSRSFRRSLSQKSQSCALKGLRFCWSLSTTITGVKYILWQILRNESEEILVEKCMWRLRTVVSFSISG